MLCAKVEAELAELDDDEALELLAVLRPGRVRASPSSRASGFPTLGLQTFLTAGPKGAAGLDHPPGETAPEAAGEIHTDFQKHFIKAEVVSYDDLVAAGSMAAVRAAGKARVEGKEYVMRDGDVVEFRVGRLRYIGARRLRQRSAPGSFGLLGEP